MDFWTDVAICSERPSFKKSSASVPTFSPKASGRFTSSTPPLSSASSSRFSRVRDAANRVREKFFKVGNSYKKRDAKVVKDSADIKIENAQKYYSIDKILS